MDNNTEEYYENIHARWEKEFPNAPFSISLPDEYLDQLDLPYTNQDIIIIKDDRTNSYYYSNCDPKYKKKFINYMVIKSKNKKITLRHILNKMIKNKHYSNKVVIEDDHHFLEFFDKKNNNIYEPSFGS